MTTEATISSTWRNRQLMMTAFLFGFGLWFLYDGMIGYPSKNEQFAKFEEMQAAGTEGEWEAFALEKGWPAKPPKHAYEPSQIRTQYILAGVSMALGGSALVWLLVCRTRKLRMDDEAIYGDTGKKVLFDSIQGVNKKKWESKGIAYAIYEEAGKTQNLTIDDYKYAGGEEILKEVEARLGLEEPEPEEESPADQAS